MASWFQFHCNGKRMHSCECQLVSVLFNALRLVRACLLALSLLAPALLPLKGPGHQMMWISVLFLAVYCGICCLKRFLLLFFFRKQNIDNMFKLLPHEMFLAWIKFKQFWKRMGKLRNVKKKKKTFDWTVPQVNRCCCQSCDSVIAVWKIWEEDPIHKWIEKIKFIFYSFVHHITLLQSTLFFLILLLSTL